MKRRSNLLNLTIGSTDCFNSSVCGRQLRNDVLAVDNFLLVIDRFLVNGLEHFQNKLFTEPL